MLAGMLVLLCVVGALVACTAFVAFDHHIRSLSEAIITVKISQNSANHQGGIETGRFQNPGLQGR